MGIEERSLLRRKNIVAHRAESFKEAEDWDLDFWQALGPDARLSALAAIREDIRKIERPRQKKGGMESEEA